MLLKIDPATLSVGVAEAVFDEGGAGSVREKELGGGEDASAVDAWVGGAAGAEDSSSQPERRERESTISAHEIGTCFTPSHIH